MYRVSENGAVWEIEYVHYSNYIEFDFYHNFKITLAHFFNLNQKDMLNRIKDNNSYNLIPFENGIDVEILDVVHEYQSEIKEAVKNRQLTEAQAIQNAIHMNNIIKTTRVLMEVHKPGRITLDQVEEEIARLQTKSFS
jgi:hypothetical protein